MAAFDGCGWATVMGCGSVAAPSGHATRARGDRSRKLGLLVQLVERVDDLQSVAARNRHDLTFAPLSAVPERVTFPIDISRLANPRWQKLGYRSLSAYITALIRYDLLVGEPHASTTADCRSKAAAKVDAENARR